MKKLIVVLAAMAITAGAYAQTESTHRKTSPPDHNQHQNMQNNPVDRPYPDGVMMQNGKMMRVKDGQYTTLQDNDMTLSNGTKFLSNGTWITKDGKETMMTEGQHMDMYGNIITVNKDKYMNPNSNMQSYPNDRYNPDGVMMQNGKMMRVKNGQMTTLEDNDMTLSNGTRIMSDGTCIRKDGTKVTMKEGQHMDMSGNLIYSKTDKDKNMYLVPDSTLRDNK